MTLQQPNGLGSGAMFDGIAKNYDRLNRVISLGIDQHWRSKACQALDSMAGELTVIDAASGTGDLAFALANHRASRLIGNSPVPSRWAQVPTIHPAAFLAGLRPKIRDRNWSEQSNFGDKDGTGRKLSKVICLDPSANMLEVAKTKAAVRKDQEIFDFVVGNIEDYQSARKVDAITMSFGIRNVVDRAAALANMFRLLVPGGKLVILELAEPKQGLIAAAARLHIHHVVPLLGKLGSPGGEYRYLQQSIADFPAPQAFAKMIEAAGFVVEQCTPLTFGVCRLYVARVPHGSSETV